jgi:cytoskeleton protein RodZ
MPVQVQETLFGDHLRRAREFRGVSLEEVSVGTRIPPRYLDAIEAEQWELLPGGVFNRGYVRAIARFLGLGEDELLAEYEMASRPAREAAALPPKPEEPPPRDYTPLYLFLGGCVVILFLLGLGVHMLRPRVANWMKSRSAHAATAEPLPMPAVPSADPAPALAEKHRAADPAPATVPAAAETKQPAVKSATPASSSVSLAVPAPVAVTHSAVGSAPEVSVPAPPPSPVANLTASAPAAGLTGILELKVEVQKRTKVMVNGDGRVLVSRILSPGDTRTFQAHDHFDVAVKDPSAVRLELDGQVQPPLKASTGRWNVTLNQDSLKKSEGGSH